ncbi:MAG: hypothetical protein LBS03_05250, partial [Bacteroidales bacterium]|nr:hypothetical protein [Bacteroidales bacterium]
MKKLSILNLTITAVFSVCCIMYGCTGGSDIAALEKGFNNPPSSARSGVYWYFMDGNFSREAVTKDL